MRERLLPVALESFVVLLLALFLFVALKATHRAGMDSNARADLRLQRTESLYAQYISEQGIGALVALDSVASLGTLDTLRVTGDTSALRSLARGGYLRDQIDLVNGRAIVAALQDLYAVSTGKTLTPAPYTVYERMADRRVPRPLVTAEQFVVPSPFLSREWKTVVGRDYRRAASLAGFDGAVALRENAASDGLIEPVHLNGKPCFRRWRVGDSLQIYCRGRASAIQVGRFFDIAYVTSPGDGNLGGRFITYRPGESVHYNGRTQTRLDHVTAGDIIEFANVGPSLISVLDQGALSSRQWVNGRSVYLSTGTGPLRRLSAIGRDASTSELPDSPLRLSFHSALSEAIQDAVERFHANHLDLIDRMGVVILDLQSGGVLAIGESGIAEDSPPMSFVPRLPGSVVKPILFAAALTRDPALRDLMISHEPGLISSVGNAVLERPMQNESNGCPPVVSISTGIQCSSNRMAVEVVTRALGGVQRSQNVLPIDQIDRSALVDGLGLAFNVNAASGRARGRDHRVWSPDGPSMAPRLVPRNTTLSPYESRPWLSEKDAGVAADNIARYAIGAWENRWTMVGLASAYAKIASGRNVEATFWADAPPMELSRVWQEQVAQAMYPIREGLALVVTRGTGSALTPRFLDNFPAASGLVLYGKTGTLNHDNPGSTDLDVYMKSLALAIGRPEGTAPGAALKCGLVAITSIDFRQDWRQRIRASRAAALPSLHLSFANSTLAPTLGSAWRALSLCP